MYHTKINGTKRFSLQSKGYGESIQLYGDTKQGETPVSLLNIALASCVGMCVQSYFYQKSKEEIEINVLSDFEPEKKETNLLIQVNQKITAELENDLLVFIEEKCRVKKVLHQDFVWVIRFESMKGDVL